MTSERGDPREQYERTYILIPPGGDAGVARAVVDATWDSERWTVGGSADDAGIGDLDMRRIIAINPDAWGSDLKTFFEEHYPGVVYWPLVYENEYQLKGRLLAYSLLEGGLSLQYPLGHGTARDIHITNKFGVWCSTYYHMGLDLRASWSIWGDEVVSATSGTVIEAGYYSNSGGLGYRIRVRTTMPDGRTVRLRYAHLAEGGLYVGVGDKVEAGQKLGRPDNTGVSTGDHLHFDVALGDPAYADPELLVDWGGLIPTREASHF